MCLLFLSSFQGEQSGSNRFFLFDVFGGVVKVFVFLGLSKRGERGHVFL